MKDNFSEVFAVFKKNYVAPPLEKYGNHPYKTLILTLLSARTKDSMNFKVCEEKLFPRTGDIKMLRDLDIKTIEELIYPVKFYKTKARHLKMLAEMVVENFDGKISDTREGLMSLPGVGRKTANLVLNRAFDMPAIAVDTHVHKITNLLGWVNTSIPEKTEVELMKVLPKKYWTDINRLFVSIGQQYQTTKRQLE